MSRLSRLIGKILQFIRDEPAMPPGMKIGKNVFIDPSAVLDPWHGRHITISNNVTIAPGVRILCHDASSKKRLGVTLVAPVDIGDNVFIGADSLILPGVRIGAGAVIAAGAVVTQEVDSGIIVAGVPAKFIGLVSDLDRQRLDELKMKPVFDETIYNRRELNRDLKDEIDGAIEKERLYYLATPEIARKMKERRQ